MKMNSSLFSRAHKILRFSYTGIWNSKIAFYAFIVVSIHFTQQIFQRIWKECENKRRVFSLCTQYAIWRISSGLMFL